MTRESGTYADVQEVLVDNTGFTRFKQILWALRLHCGAGLSNRKEATST